MVGALIQSATTSAAVAHQRLSSSGISKTQITRSAKLVFAKSPPSQTLQSFSGMRRNNIVDVANKSDDRMDLISLVASFISRAPRVEAVRGVAVAMYQRFNKCAIKVAVLAQVEARRLDHNFVGSEQIIMSLIHEDTGFAAQVLKSMGVTLKVARLEVERIIRKCFVSVEISCLLERKMCCISLSEEARQLGSNHIGPEHLLCGLLPDRSGVLACVLKNLGADPSKLSAEVIRMMNGEN